MLMMSSSSYDPSFTTIYLRHVSSQHSHGYDLRSLLLTSSSAAGRGAASTCIFEEIPTELFRQRVAACLQALLTEAQTNQESDNTDAFRRYDRNRIQEGLEKIAWPDLLNHFDACHQRSCATVTEVSASPKGPFASSSPFLPTGTIARLREDRHDTADRPGHASLSTPLVHLLDLLLDARVWPLCAAEPLVRILLSALVESRSLRLRRPRHGVQGHPTGQDGGPPVYRSNETKLAQSSRTSSSAGGLVSDSWSWSSWLPSERYLWQSVGCILRQQPWLLQKRAPCILHDLARSSGSNTVHYSAVVASGMVVKRCKAMLSIIKQWVRTWPMTKANRSGLTSLLPCLWAVLHQLDQADSAVRQARILAAPHESNRRTDDQEPLMGKRRRGQQPMCASVGWLHGHDSASDTEAKLPRAKRMRHIQPRPGTIRHSRNHIRPGLSNLPLGAEEADPVRDEKLTLSLNKLRGKCLQMALYIASQDASSMRVTIHSWLEYARMMRTEKGPSSFPSMLLFGMLLADGETADRDRRWLTVVDMIWLRVQGEACPAFWLRWYAQIIAEGSCFDQEENLHLAMSPLMTLLQATCDEFQNETEHRSLPEQDYERTRLFRQCFAFLLRRRGYLLPDKSHLASLSACMSVCFDRSEDWIDESMPGPLRAQTIATLQQAGILGICDDNLVDKDSYREQPGSDCQLSLPTTQLELPFPTDGAQLRSVAQLLSCWIPSMSRLLSKAGHNVNSVRRSSEPVVPTRLDRTLTDDVLHVVFSFLNYKRLLRMRYVSHSFKSAADHDGLWKLQYQTRYGIQSDDRLAKDCSWKKSFADKWIIEREVLRFPRNNDEGWRIRMCSYVGCCQILTKPCRMAKHYAVHSRGSQPGRTRKLQLKRGRNANQASI